MLAAISEVKSTLCELPIFEEIRAENRRFLRPPAMELGGP